MCKLLRSNIEDLLNGATGICSCYQLCGPILVRNPARCYGRDYSLQIHESRLCNSHESLFYNDISREKTSLLSVIMQRIPRETRYQYERHIYP